MGKRAAQVAEVMEMLEVTQVEVEVANMMEEKVMKVGQGLQEYEEG